MTHAAEDFESLFFEPMQKAGILNNEGKERLINYQRLHNPFLVVEHDGNKNKVKQNPHKSYGYLAQPRLGSWLGDFLIGNLNNDATLASRLDSENAPLLHHPVA